MKGAVVKFPGSNCGQDVFRAMTHTGISTEYLWHKESRLTQKYDLIVIPGGFSWGDYLRPGALSSYSPVMKEIKEFANKGGRVIGICNGFQILCESGLLPGVLMINRHLQFICAHRFLKVNKNSSMLLRHLPDSPVNFPIAHRDGNYFIDPNGLKRLQDQELISFYYADQQGNITPDSNPNGSLANIAGITNPKGNILGLMPHPERAMEPLKGMTDGTRFWKSIVRSL